MICPECAHTKLRVIDSRATSLGIRRRRQCTRCGHRWTTIEMNDEIALATYNFWRAAYPRGRPRRTTQRKRSNV